MQTLHLSEMRKTVMISSGHRSRLAWLHTCIVLVAELGDFALSQKVLNARMHDLNIASEKLIGSLDMCRYLRN